MSPHRSDDTTQHLDDSHDLLDSGIRAAFGLDPEADAPTSNSVLHAFRRTGKAPGVLLREGGEDESPVTLTPDAAGDDAPWAISRYQVLGEIARGGVGSILKARDVDLGREVAVKVLLNVHRGNAEMTRRFLEEAQIGGQLQHPGIVPVHEIGLLADERPYFAMKLVKGKTLAELLDSRTSPAEERQRFLGIFEQVCQTLAYAHTRGVMHRDLKPSNVMVGQFGDVQVMDWGLAKVLPKGGVVDDRRTTRAVEPRQEVRPSGQSAGRSDRAVSVAGSVMGTPAYMPPEQARGEIDALDERSDVFGLGAILCEILTSKPPYTGAGFDDIFAKARDGNLGDARARLAACGAHPDLIELTEDCLRADARERPRNALVVAKRIRGHLESIERRAREAQMRAAKTRLKLVVALLVLAVVVLGGGGYFLVDRERREREATVRDALAQTDDLVHRADNERDASLWDAARREAERARDLAARGVGPALREKANQRFEDVAARVRDQTAVVQLERLREEQRDADDQELKYRFNRVFLSYGIDVDRMDPQEAAELVQASGIATELVLGLDQWAVTLNSPWRDEREARDKRLEVALLADTDPWRKTLREAVRDGDTEKLMQLAEEAQTRQLAPSTFEVLVDAIRSQGMRGRRGPDDRGGRRGRRDDGEPSRDRDVTSEEATIEALWRRAQRLYPQDFWINLRLGEHLLDFWGRRRAGEREARKKNAEQALQYLRAAVALRPSSAHAVHQLGIALDWSDARAEAITQLTRAISLRPDERSGFAYYSCTMLIENLRREVGGSFVVVADTDPRETSDDSREPSSPAPEESARTNPRQSVEDPLEPSSPDAEEIKIVVPGSVLEELLATLRGIQRGEGDYHEDGLTHLLAVTLFATGEREHAIAVLEESIRRRGGARGGRGGPGRGFPNHAKTLARMRDAVHPDIVSFASIDAVLAAIEKGAEGPERLAQFRAHHADATGADARARLYYLAARELEDADRFSEAAARFASVIALHGESPEPILRRAECLRAAGEPRTAETELGEALRRGDIEGADAWRLWASLCLVDLGRDAPASLAAFPAPQSVTRGAPGMRFAEDLRWGLERLAAGQALRINCGGLDHRSADGAEWSRDRFGTIEFQHPMSTFPQRDLAGTDDDPLRATWMWLPRWAEEIRVGYEVPLPSGAYTVTLHVAEDRWRGGRRGRRESEGEPVAADLDLQVDLESAPTRVEGERGTFEVEVADGSLSVYPDLEDRRGGPRPRLCALEIRAR